MIFHETKIMFCKCRHQREEKRKRQRDKEKEREGREVGTEGDSVCIGQ